SGAAASPAPRRAAGSAPARSASPMARATRSNPRRRRSVAGLLELRPVAGELLMLPCHHILGSVPNKPLVPEPALGALDFGAERLAPLCDPAPDLVRV